MPKTDRNLKIYEKARACDFSYGIMNILAQEYGLTRSRISHIVKEIRDGQGKEVEATDYTVSLGSILVTPAVAAEVNALCKVRGWPRPFALRKAVELLLIEESTN